MLPLFHQQHIDYFKTCLIINDYLNNIFFPNLLYNFIHKGKYVVCCLRCVGSVNWRMVYHSSITINHEIDDRLSSPRTSTITHDCVPIYRSFSLQCCYIYLKLLHLLLQICVSNLVSHGTFDPWTYFCYGINHWLIVRLTINYIKGYCIKEKEFRNSFTHFFHAFSRKQAFYWFLLW